MTTTQETVEAFGVTGARFEYRNGGTTEHPRYEYRQLGRNGDAMHGWYALEGEDWQCLSPSEFRALAKLAEAE